MTLTNSEITRFINSLDSIGVFTSARPMELRNLREIVLERLQPASAQTIVEIVNQVSDELTPDMDPVQVGQFLNAAVTHVIQNLDPKAQTMLSAAFEHFANPND